MDNELHIDRRLSTHETIWQADLGSCLGLNLDGG
jgi:hypothetical protein